MEKKFTVIVADDHQGIRQGIIEILETERKFEVIAEAENGKEAVQLVKNKNPDLLILDVKLPGMMGPDVAQELTETDQPTKILALSSYDYPQFIQDMISNGAQGYLTKDEAPDLLLTAAGEILKGQADLFISADLQEKTRIDITKHRETSHNFSKMEFVILDLVKKGYQAAEIADQLDFPLNRVSRYLRILMVKYQVNSVEELRSAI
jgi:DNA-binding NarL/FixJ family response regulator